MHRSLKAAVLVLGLCLYGQAHALTYYVRSDGNDGANGRNNTTSLTTGAKRTISSLNATVNVGDTVFIVSINHSDTTSTTLNRINPTRAGADGDPIVYRSFDAPADSAMTNPVPGMDPINDINLTIVGVRFKGHVKFQYPVRNIQIDTSIFMNFWSCEGAENIHIRGGRSYKASGETGWTGWGGAQPEYHPDYPNRNIQCSDHFVKHDGIGDEMQGIYQRGGCIDVQWNRVTFNAMWNPTLGGSGSTSNLISVAGYNTGARFDSCRFIMNFVPGTGYDPVTWYGVVSMRDEADGTVFDSCSFDINRLSTSGTEAVFIHKTGTSTNPNRNTTISRSVFKIYNGYIWDYDDKQPNLEVKNCVILTRGNANSSGYRVTNNFGSGVKFHHNTIYAPFGRSLYTGDYVTSGPVSINNNIFVRVNSADHQDSVLVKATYFTNTTMNKNLYWTTNGVAGDSAYCVSYSGTRYSVKARLSGATGTLCTSQSKECNGIFANPGFSSYNFDTFDPSPKAVAGSTNYAVGDHWGRHPDSTTGSSIPGTPANGWDGNPDNDCYVGAISPAVNPASDTIPPKPAALSVEIEIGDVTKKRFSWVESGDDSATGKAESVFVCEKLAIVFDPPDPDGPGGPEPDPPAYSIDFSTDRDSADFWRYHLMTGFRYDAELDSSIADTAKFAALLTGSSRILSGTWGTDAAPEPCPSGPCIAAYYCIVTKDDAGNFRLGPTYRGDYYP